MPFFSGASSYKFWFGNIEISTSGRIKNENSAMEYTTPLPEDFVPGDHDVVINKGKRFFHHKGNAWLRDIASCMIDKYAAASSKLEKSLIISDVVDHVRINGNFVKRGPGAEGWVHAEELLCREKTSAVFRDSLQFTKKSGSRTRTLQRVNCQKDQDLAALDDTKGIMDRSGFDYTVTPSIFSSDYGVDRFLVQDEDDAFIREQLPLQNWTQGDLFCILSHALSGMEEDQNPFEPRPLFEDV